MAVKIRLQRKGRKKNPFYHIVIADARSPRDGKYIERIGSYNPMTDPATITLDNDKALAWLKNGAQPTYTANAILRFKGVLYKKHLMRGVSKGALTEDQANNLYEEFIAQKEERITSRIEKVSAEKITKKEALLEELPVVEEVIEEVVEETAEEVTEEIVAEAGAETVEEAAEEAAEEVVEETTEEVTEEIVAEAGAETPSDAEPEANEDSADSNKEE